MIQPSTVTTTKPLRSSVRPAVVIILCLFFWTTTTSHASLHFALVPKTTDNPFFQFAWNGCVDASALFDNVTCHYGGIAATDENPNPDLDGTLQAAYLGSLLTQDDPPLDGLAVSAKNPDLLRPLIQQAVTQRRIPVVTFDSDVPRAPRWAYIGTDNFFMGETLAKALHQIKPHGGTYAVLMGDDSPNIVERTAGLRHTLENRGGVWIPWPGSPYNYQRDLDRALNIMEDLAQHNITAIVATVGGPLFHANYTDFYKRHRHRNITIVAADDFAVQIAMLSQGYVQGLVGQMPYEMGFQAARLLYSLQSTRYNQSGQRRLIYNPSIATTTDVPVIGTNLITHIQVPLTLPELTVDHNLISHLRIIGYILLAIILSTAGVCIIWAVTQRNHAVVKAAQPVFLMLVAAGVVILGSTIVPLSMDDDGDADSISNTKATWICMSVPWLACCGFTITFSALFSKTLRITRIFTEARRYHRVQVTAVDVLVPFSMLFCANVIVLILWSVLDPLVYTRINNAGMDGWNRVLSTFGACRCDNPLAYAMPLAAINAGVLALAIWQAYQSRHIRLEFAESKYIFICMVSLLEALVICIPILIVVRDSPQAFYLTIIFMVFCICMGVLLLIFVPKIGISAQYSQLTLVEQNRKILEGIQEAAAPMAAATSGGSVPKLASSTGPTRDTTTPPLSHEELERLSERITSLPAKHLEGVVRIIRQAASSRPVDPEVDEIDVDLNQLSADTQRRLLGYVSEVDHDELDDKNLKAPTAQQGEKGLHPNKVAESETGAHSC